MKYVFNPFSGKFDAVGLYFKENGYTLELWYKGQKLDEWVATPPSTGPGQPMGLLLTLTYAA